MVVHRRDDDTVSGESVQDALQPRGAKVAAAGSGTSHDDDVELNGVVVAVSRLFFRDLDDTRVALTVDRLAKPMNEIGTAWQWLRRCRLYHAVRLAQVALIRRANARARKQGGDQQRRRCFSRRADDGNVQQTAVWPLSLVCRDASHREFDVTHDALWQAGKEAPARSGYRQLHGPSHRQPTGKDNHVLSGIPPAGPVALSSQTQQLRQRRDHPS